MFSCVGFLLIVHYLTIIFDRKGLFSNLKKFDLIEFLIKKKCDYSQNNTAPGIKLSVCLFVLEDFIIPDAS